VTEESARTLARIGPGATAAVGPLISSLESGPREVAEKAAYALVAIAPDDEEALRALVAALGTGARRPAELALASAGPGAVPLLIEALGEEDPTFQAAAARSLGTFGKDATAAVPALLRAAGTVKDQKGHPARQDFILALAGIGPPVVPQLVKGLSDKDPAIRATAAGALRDIGSGAIDAVPALVRSLDDPDIEVRALACEALGVHGPAAREAVPHLVSLVRQGKVAVQRNAVDALGRIGVFSRAAESALLDVLSRKDLNTGLRAARALVLIGGDPAPAIPILISSHSSPDAAKLLALIGKPAVPALVEALDHPNLFVKKGVVMALGEMDNAGAAEAVPSLVASLEKKSDIRLRYLVCRTLGNIGPGAVDALPALKQLLHDGEQAYPYAVEAIGKIAPDTDDTVQVMIEVLRGSHYIARERAAEALAGMGPQALEAVPVLFELLEKRDTPKKLRIKSAVALGKLAGHDGFPIERLVDGIGSSNYYLRVGAATALIIENPRNQTALDALIDSKGSLPRGIGTLAVDGLLHGGQPAIEALINDLPGTKTSQTVGILRAIGSFGEEAVFAVPVIIRTYEDAVPRVRNNCVKTLGEIGPGAKAALPLIEVELHDERDRNRLDAYYALEKIDPERAARTAHP
jgi:HEAT repeat protein